MRRYIAYVVGCCVVATIGLACAPRPRSMSRLRQPPMIRIPSGTYTIGTDTGPENERPAHTVEVKAYYIDEYEVTNAMYGEFIKETHYPPPLRWRPDSTYWKEDADLPVTWISWFDASAYAAWRGCRLPTEVEWEVAARGTTDYAYPWGDSARLADGKIPANCEGAADGYPYGPAPVGTYKDGRSPFGVYDMAGNVWEWTEDWYLPAAYQDSLHRGTQAAVTDSLYGQRSIRGGSWFDPIQMCRTTSRAGFDPSYRSDIIGFRCVRDAR